MSADLRCDVAIVGAGSAGLAAERSARAAGANTLLIDAEFSGTTCATDGCMPSKLLIAAANVAHSVAQASRFGIHSSAKVDGHEVMSRVRHERDAFAAATRDEIARLPPGVAVRGVAKLVGATRLQLQDGREVHATAIVCATGSRPAFPKQFGAIRERVLTNENIFELRDLPRSVAVVGGGPLGLELAQAMARLGVAVVLLDEKEALGGTRDQKMIQSLLAVLSAEFEIHLGVELHAEMKGDGVLIRWIGKSSGERQFDQVLLATGRPPNLESLNLRAAGLELDARGVPVFDQETLRCGDSPIFLAGDVDASRPVLHVAVEEGSIAGFNAARYPNVTPQRRTIPLSIMFTSPPLVMLGDPSSEGAVVGEASYEDQGRAKVEGCNSGLVRIFANPNNGQLSGAILFCPGADHLGHLLAWAMEQRMNADRLLDLPFYHPTFEEGLKPALRMICAKAGIRARSTRDAGNPSGA